MPVGEEEFYQRACHPVRLSLRPKPAPLLAAQRGGYLWPGPVVEAALELDPASAEAYLALARLKATRGEFDKAREAYEQALLRASTTALRDEI